MIISGFAQHPQHLISDCVEGAARVGPGGVPQTKSQPIRGGNTPFSFSNSTLAYENGVPLATSMKRNLNWQRATFFSREVFSLVNRGLQHFLDWCDHVLTIVQLRYQKQESLRGQPEYSALWRQRARHCVFSAAAVCSRLPIHFPGRTNDYQQSATFIR